MAGKMISEYRGKEGKKVEAKEKKVAKTPVTKKAASPSKMKKC